MSIRALTDRVVLEFPPAVAMAGSITVPPEYRLREEMGRVVAHGPASTKQGARALKLILRLSGNTGWQKWRARHLPTFNRWLGWTRPSCRFLIPIMLGSRLWNEDVIDKDGKYASLLNYRSYSIMALSVAITNSDGDVADATPCLCQTQEHIDRVARGGLWECACTCEAHRPVHIYHRTESEAIRSKLTDTSAPFVRPDKLRRNP